MPHCIPGTAPLLLTALCSLVLVAHDLVAALRAGEPVKPAALPGARDRLAAGQPLKVVCFGDTHGSL